MEVVGLPIAGDHAGEFPAELSDNVKVRVSVDNNDKQTHAHAGDGVSRGRKIFAELLAAANIEHKVAKQRSVLRREEVHDRGIDLKKMTIKYDVIEHLSVEAEAKTVHGITTKHAKGHKLVVKHLIQQIDTT